MSSSTQLRENYNQHVVKNRVSKKKEKLLALAVAMIVNKLVSNHPQFQFKVILNSSANSPAYKPAENLLLVSDNESKLSNRELIQKMRRIYPNMEGFADDENVEDGFINPDGSVVLIRIGGEWRVVIISEHKNQGTNNLRTKEGKKKQAKGNALERAGKNLIFIRDYSCDENITPYCLFFEGCDLAVGSSIRGRLFAMNQGHAFNRIHLYAERGLRPVSMFVREEAWSLEEMTNILDDIASKSIAYYLGKYQY